MNNKLLSSVVKRLVAEVLWGFKNQPYTTTRWAWVQLLSSFAFFFIALSLAIIALLFSIKGVTEVPIGFEYAGLVMAGMALLVGVIFIVLAFRMGWHWYSLGTQDPTATKSDIEKLRRQILLRPHLNIISRIESSYQRKKRRR